jgi:putative transposase
MGRFEIPDGWAVQAFSFALDCTPEQGAYLRRHFGGRRYARNWAVRTLKQDLIRYHETGEQTAAPSLAGLHLSKEAFADGIRAAVAGYWNWQSSRGGARQGRRVGFRGLRRRAATGTGLPSPPARSGSSPIGGTSRCPGSAPSGCTRTPAACSG